MANKNLSQGDAFAYYQAKLAPTCRGSKHQPLPKASLSREKSLRHKGSPRLPHLPHHSVVVAGEIRMGGQERTF
ncbi:MAG: hypothetical protein KJ666_16535 [Bacteroidetes bacterium]|nr:hypothetical protein [Bacteroidota bacterium]MBU2586074.1 hypothetical protein [Bacteroidota bacterium]